MRITRRSQTCKNWGEDTQLDRVDGKCKSLLVGMFEQRSRLSGMGEGENGMR